MAVAVLNSYRSAGLYYGMYASGGVNDPACSHTPFGNTIKQHFERSLDIQDADKTNVRAASERDSDVSFRSFQTVPVVAKSHGEPAAYTRYITACIKTQELCAQETADGNVIYSYAETERSFQIVINSDKDENKTYTIKGVDENGREFEREFDPYQLDPEDMDYPEFSALCMYIQQTNETADLIASSYFTDTSYFDGIFDRGNRVELLGKYSKDLENIGTVLAEHAQRLYAAINEFFKGISNSMNSVEDRIPLLFEDRDRLTGTSYEDNSESKTEKLTPLGIGFANAGVMGYGMSASLVEVSGNDDTIVRVKIAKGGGRSETIDVNLSDFDPRNATAVEMFAYCQYKDATSSGNGYKWGSWNAIKGVISPNDGMDFGSLDNIMNEKINWTGALARSDTSLQDQKSGETVSAEDLLRLFEEYMNRTLDEIKDTDLRDKTDKFIRENIITSNTEYTDPATKQRVPVNIKYITSYSENGITCRKMSDVGGKTSERELWTIAYNSPEDNEKVQSFLRSFSDEQRLTFATQQNFWSDFLKDDFDIEGFKSFYDTTDNGRIDIERAKEKGKSLRDTLTEPNAEYFNNKSFAGHVWTEQEMWDNWYARIDASRSESNKKGMEPPTETITVKNNTARSYRDQAFRYIGSNASDRVRKAWLDAADEIGIDGQGITDIGTLDHIPQFMIRRFIMQYNGMNSDDILGSTVGSAIKAAREAIYSLDHPLEPNRMRSAEELKLKELEKAFYERFIEKLSVY